MGWSLVTYLQHPGLTCWFRSSFHKKTDANKIGHFKAIFLYPRENTCASSTSTVIHSGHEKPLSSDFMRFVFSLSSRPLPKTPLFAHYPDHKTSSGSHFAQQGDTVCSAIFHWVEVDWRRKGFLLIILASHSGC